MVTHDYNGTGPWSAYGIQARYRDHANRLQVQPERDLEPSRHREGDAEWVYPVMEAVIAGIEDGDLACAAIGVEFLEQDQGFPFGAILKSNTARALRRFAALPPDLVERLRDRIVSMLATGTVPREFRQYAKLLRRIGVGDHWARIDAAVGQNRLASRALAYIRRHFEREAPADES